MSEFKLNYIKYCKGVRSASVDCSDSNSDTHFAKKKTHSANAAKLRGFSKATRELIFNSEMIEQLLKESSYSKPGKTSLARLLNGK